MSLLELFVIHNKMLNDAKIQSGSSFSVSARILDASQLQIRAISVATTVLATVHIMTLADVLEKDRLHWTWKCRHTNSQTMVFSLLAKQIEQL